VNDPEQTADNKVRPIHSSKAVRRKPIDARSFQLDDQRVKRLTADSLRAASEPKPARKQSKKPAAQPVADADEPHAYLAARIPKSVIRRVKYAALDERRKIQDWLLEAVLAKLEKEGK